MRQIVVTGMVDESRCLGLILPKGVTLKVDVLDEQLPSIQSAIDSGDIVVDGMAATAAPVVEDEAPKKKGK